MGDENLPGKILVIDDEHGTLNMLRLLLGAHGYTVMTADSGENGLELFRREAPAIVLTDIRMPGLDGIEVLKRLKQIDANVEVIVITGHGDLEVAVQALQNQASDFITKPVQGPALEVALRRAQEKISLRTQLKDYTHNLEAKVAEATKELARSCRHLEVLYEISQAMGEMASLVEVIDLLKDRIQSIVGARCHVLLVLNGQGTGLAAGQHGAEVAGTAHDFWTAMRELERPRPLTDAERTRLFPGAPVPESEKLIMVPILREGEAPVGAALLELPAEGCKDKMRLVSLFLAQAVGAIRRAVAREEELQALRQIVGVREQFGDILGRHERMEQIFKLVSNVADSDATVLIQGESGTGKELIARRIHELSSRRAGPLVVISCAAYPQTLLESELFGHEKGAFTGAFHARKGSFELANGGTIFLDEIGDIPLAAQVKLLRVLQFREFQRIGSGTTTKVDVRVLAATSRNLLQEIERGNFREDLYYRLHVIPIMMPALRERMSDVPLLAQHFLRKLSERSTKKVLGIAPTVMRILLNNRWPGNIRELENVIEHAFVLARGESIEVNDLPASLQEIGGPTPGGPECLEDVEKEHLVRVLKQCQGNKIEAARRLKISRSTLYRKLEYYRVSE